MTKNMLRILEMIYRSDPQEGYAQHSTAYALERAGLVSVGGVPNPERTQAGDFPHYWATLTDKGRHFCKSRFG